MDEYTSDYINNKSLQRLGDIDTMKVGVSPTRYGKKIKYKDANYMP